MASKARWYVVWVGRVPGVYTDWNKARLQVDGYPNARYKGYSDRGEAYRAFREGNTTRVVQSPKTPVKRRVKWQPGESVVSPLILHMQLAMDQLAIKLRLFRRENPDWISPEVKAWKHKPFNGRR